jgi:uncharacterized membrane protein (UPF0127 family)
LISILTFVAVVLFSFRVVLPRLSSEKPAYEERKLKVGATTLTVEIAETASQMEKGLGDRVSLPVGRGMIFLYPQEVTPRFWMKDMHFDIDIVWIRDNRVVDISAGVRAPVDESSELPFYVPKEPVTMVLEVPAGYTQEHNLTFGDAVELL